ncbi:methyltransferase [Streptomyces sp. NPDC054784]
MSSQQSDPSRQLDAGTGAVPEAGTGVDAGVDAGRHPHEPYGQPRLSLAAVVGRLRAAGCVFAEDEAELLLAEAPTPAALAALTDRRAAGEPLELVLGWAEFRGLRVRLEPGVFVPRRRTEFLVRQALALGHQAEEGSTPVVVDLCCGSGAVGAALAVALERVELHAADVDPVAVRCARRNLAAALRGGRGHGTYGGGYGESGAGGSGTPHKPYAVHEGDLFAALPGTLRGRVDILAANVPYVPSDEIALLPSEARDHEPRTALDGGADGLDVLRRVAAEAAHWLAPGGCLLVETSERQEAEAVAVLRRGGLGVRVKRSEELCATVVIATRLPARGR